MNKSNRGSGFKRESNGLDLINGEELNTRINNSNPEKKI